MMMLIILKEKKKDITCNEQIPNFKDMSYNIIQSCMTPMIELTFERNVLVR